MSYVRYRLRQKVKYIRLAIASVLVGSFFCTNSSFAGSWSCTPPPNIAVESDIARYPSSYIVAKDEYIIRIVESSLEHRLGFKSRIVSCAGNYCRISDEFINFIGRDNINIPSTRIHMSICSAHNSDCLNSFCENEYQENYDVIYAWKDGRLRLKLDISNKNDKLSIDEIMKYNVPPDERFKDYYERYIGVTRNSRLFIGISSYISGYYE